MTKTYTEEELKTIYAENLVLHNKSMRESLFAMKLGLGATVLHICTLILNVYMLTRVIELVTALHP